MIRVVVVRLLLRSAAPEDDHPGGGGRGRHSPVLVKDERDDRMEKMHRVSKDILEDFRHHANPKLTKTRVECKVNTYYKRTKGVRL